jgi:hypothetical protein
MSMNRSIEYEKIHRHAEEYATPIIKVINELHVYYRCHIKNGIVLGKGLKIVRYQTFVKKRNQALNQALKRLSAHTLKYRRRERARGEHRV